MNNSCFPVGQVCNLSGQDAILSYDYFCDAIIRHAGVNSSGAFHTHRSPFIAAAGRAAVSQVVWGGTKAS
jgi:hypothetical protein